MYKLILLSIAALLIVIRAGGQSPQTEYPRSVLIKIQKSKPDTNRIKLILNLGNYYLSIPNKPDSALYYINQGMALSIKLHDPDLQYEAMEMMGNYYQEVGDMQRCKEFIMRAIAYYHKKGNINEEAHGWEGLADMESNDTRKDYRKESISYYLHARSLYLQNHQLAAADTALRNIADIYIEDKQYDLAKNELQQILADYKALGVNMLYTYDQLYQIEYAKGNYYLALDYCLQGIKSMKAGGDTTFAELVYFGASKCNYAIKNYKESIDWMGKITSGNLQYKLLLVQDLLELNRLEEARVTVDKLLRKQLPADLAGQMSLYWMAALYYRKINNKDLSLQYIAKVSELSKDRSITPTIHYLWILYCNREIAINYLKAKQATKARKYLDKVALVLKSLPTPIDPGFTRDFYANLYQYDTLTNNYKTAVKDLERHDKLQDSLLTVDKDNKVIELNLKYQTSRKDQSIKDLHNQTIIQKAGLKNANLQRNVTVGGIFLVLIIASLLYRQSGIRKKNSKIINHKNELLQHLVTEKEWLLKEVHHRVKNNLHSVISLLEAQASFLENDALQAIENSQHRIYAMSLIHQKLYQSDDIKTIDMAQYIPELVQYLRDSFEASHIHFNLLVDSIQLNASQAIPMGLVINEALTNSLKYAFPDGSRGEISVSLTNMDGKYKLELADNGIGMPESKSGVKKNSLGLELMNGLAKEIGGCIIFEKTNGVKITIIFEKDLLHYADQLRDDHLESA